MRLRALTTCLLTFGATGCATIGNFFAPAPIIPTRPMQRVLPAPRLVAPAEAIGSCVKFAPDGSYVLEACPPALAGMATNATDYKAPKGEHESGILVADPAKPPPGFYGDGGYWHIHEAHITHVITSQLGNGRLGALQLDRLDAMCQGVRHSGERVVVDRVYVGCAVVADGTGAVPASSEEAVQQLQAQGRRLGAPKDFRVEGGTAKDAACGGDDTTILMGIVTLTSICNEIVRETVLSNAAKDSSTATEELEKAEKELATKEQELAQIEPHDRLSRNKAAPLLAAHASLETQISSLRQIYITAQERMRVYRGDPYGLSVGDAPSGPVAQH